MPLPSLRFSFFPSSPTSPGPSSASASASSNPGTTPRPTVSSRRLRPLLILLPLLTASLGSIYLLTPSSTRETYRNSIAAYAPDLHLHLDLDAGLKVPWRAGAGAGHGSGSVADGDAEACAGWDPARGEERDPARCVRARAYRQVGRVLAREEKGEHPHWWFTKESNIETLREVQRCFLPRTHVDALECPDEPVVISGYWWAALGLKGETSGEVIWQVPVIQQFKQNGVRTLYMGPYENWIEAAEMMPDVYRFVWAPDTEVVSCITDPRCVAAEHYAPTRGGEDYSVGVPHEERGVISLWKIQIVDYWGALPKEISHNDHYWALTEDGEWSYHPLGNLWVSTPWPLPGHAHLPYSIEEQCMKQPNHPAESRTKDVLILAKKSSYFSMPHVVAPADLSDLSTVFPLVSAAVQEDGAPIPAGIRAIGKQMREGYEALVGGVSVMLGIGHPPISPSVYTALCQGTPIVMPHRDTQLQFSGPKLDLRGWQKFSGRFQHGPAMALGPPQVYSYYFRNYTQLEHAVRLASRTPIERYIPSDMAMPFVRRQARSFLARDLRKMYEGVLADLARARARTGGDAGGGDLARPAIEEHVRARCVELKRCSAPLPRGRRPSVPPMYRPVHVHGNGLGA